MSISVPETVGRILSFALALICSLIVTPYGNAARIVVVDSSDSSPIIGATLISARGVIMGITDLEGTVKGVEEKDYPLTVQSLGYKNLILPIPTDTVVMSVDTYVLPEVVVRDGARPIIRTLSYVREYCTGTYAGDTILMFTEYMAETFNTTQKKVKGYKGYDRYPKVRNKRSCARYVHPNGTDSVAVPREDEDMLSFFSRFGSLSNITVRESDSLRYDLIKADTIHGKYSPKKIMKKTANLFLITVDPLADYKDHRWSPNFFKLIGFTLDLEKLTFSDAYALNDRGEYRLEDLLYATVGIHAIGRGKWIKRILRSKEPVEMDCAFEIYPVSTTYLTLDEYKEARDELTRIPFEASPFAQPLHPSIRSIVDRLNRY